MATDVDSTVSASARCACRHVTQTSQADRRGSARRSALKRGTGWAGAVASCAPGRLPGGHGPSVGAALCRLERHGTIAKQVQHDQADGPEGRVLPAAALVGKQPAVAAVHEHDRAKHLKG